jgi:death-on-curing protein
MDSVRPLNEPPRNGCVEGAIGNAVQAAAYYSEDDEPNPLHIASHLLRSLARDHCFIDGNKRVAWLACLEVLATHGRVTIDADEIEAAAFVESVADGSTDVPGIAGWLAARLSTIN